MKRFLFFLVVFLVLGLAPAFAGTVKMTTIAAGSTAVSAGHAYSPVDVALGGANEGFFALQGRITGSGTAKIEYWLSADGTTFREPQGAIDIITGFTATSGPNSDGYFYVQFSPDFCQYIRIVITETGGAATITPTVKMLYK